MPQHCEPCGMPMTKKEDFALGDETSEFCLYCVNEDGSVKLCQEVFEGGVQFFMGAIGGDREMAEKVTRKNMNMQSYWQGRDEPLLRGVEASDEEFAQAMKKFE